MEPDATTVSRIEWPPDGGEVPAWPPLGAEDGVPDPLADLLRREARRERGACEGFLEDILFVRAIPAADGSTSVRLALVFDDWSAMDDAFDAGDALASELEAAGVPCMVDTLSVDELRLAWANGDPEAVGLHRFGRSLWRDVAAATEQAVLQVPRPEWIHFVLEQARSAATAFAMVLESYPTDAGGPGAGDLFTDADGEPWSRFTVGFSLPRIVSRLVHLLEAKGGRLDDWRLPLDESAARDLELSREEADALRGVARRGPATLGVLPDRLPFDRALREPFERLVGLALRMHARLRPMDPEPAEAGFEEAMGARISAALAAVRRANREALFARAAEAEPDDGVELEPDASLLARPGRYPCPCGSGRRWRNCCGEE